MKEVRFDPAVRSLRDTIHSLRTDPPAISKGLIRRLKELIGMMPQFPDHFLYVYNYSEGRIVYHQGFAEVLGYDDHEVDIELLYDTFHPDDAPIVGRLNEAVIRAMAEIRNPINLFALTLTVDYRMRKANGEHIKVLRQTTVFEVDETTGKVISTCSLCKDISTIKQSNLIGWQIRGAEVALEGLNEYMAHLQYRPSPREMDVIRKLAEGRSSSQIANDLCLSLHTVNTHRRNILERTGLKNTAELIRHVVQLGWL